MFEGQQKKVFAAFWIYLRPEFRIAKWVLLARKPRAADIFRPLPC